MSIPKANKKIKVLIVEDSPTVSLYLQYLLASDDEIEVVGVVANGKLAVEFVEKNRPDVISMDIDMPVMNGYDATRRIMATHPVPIIIVTASRNAKKQSTSMDALSAGALTVIQKPVDMKAGLETEQNRKFVSLVKIYAQVKVIRRRFSQTSENAISNEAKLLTGKIPGIHSLSNRKYIAIGVSTGGPDVLKMILDAISKDFPIPIVIVQHITEGFLEGMVNWLNTSSEINIKIACHGETLLPGFVYFAPDNFQMGVKNNKIELQKSNPDMKICPSVEYLFASLLKEKPEQTIAMLLTGMGNDGAKELKLLKESGALTIAQDKESSLVYGMPAKAVMLNGANSILNPEQIIWILKNIEGEKPE